MPSQSSGKTDNAPDVTPDDSAEPMIVYREQYIDDTGTVNVREHGPMKVSEFQEWEKKHDAKKA